MQYVVYRKIWIEKILKRKRKFKSVNKNNEYNFKDYGHASFKLQDRTGVKNFMFLISNLLTIRNSVVV